MDLKNFNIYDLLSLVDKHSDLNILTLSNSELEILPNEICSLKKLRSLSIKNCPKIKFLPICFSKLKEIKTLKFIACKHNRLPKNIELISSLTNLNLSNQKYNSKTDWNLLKKLGNLNSLVLSASLKSMKGCPPEEISDLKKLQFLYLDQNNLNKLPFRFFELRELLLLDISNNNFIEFPEVLIFLPKLSYLIIDAKLANTLPIEIFEIDSLKDLKIRATNLQKYPLASNLSNIFKIAHKYKFKHSFISMILDLTKYPEQFDFLELNECIDLLNCEIEELIFKTLNRIKILISADFSFPGNTSLLYISGKTFETKSVLKSKLKENNIKFCRKYSEKVTHIMLCPGHKLDFSMLNNKVLFTEDMLYIDQNFNKINSVFSENLNSIINLLISPIPDNNLIALHLIECGRLCTDLLTELVFLYKKSSSAPIHKKIISLLQKSGFLNLSLQLKRRFPLFGISENSLNNNLEFYAQFPEVDIFKLLLLIYNDSGRGKKFALLNLKKEEKQSFFEKVIINGVLDFSGSNLNILPEDFEIFSDSVFSLNISNNKFDSFPYTALSKLNNLVELNISNNPSIWHYPEDIIHLKNLKKLIVSKSFLTRSLKGLLVKLKEKKVEVQLE